MRPFLVGQAAALFQLRDRLQRVAGAQRGQIAAVEQLQELNHELDVADAAVAGLDVVGVGSFDVGPLLDAALERLDARDVGAAQVAAIDPRFELFEELSPEIEIAGDGRALTNACRSQVRPEVS